MLRLPAGSARAFAVEDAALYLHPAEILCLVGESGSGKSLLASALLGDLPDGVRMTAGAIRLGDLELSALKETEWRAVRGRRIAHVAQEPRSALNPGLRVRAQILEAFRIHGLDPGPGDRARELLIEVGLADVDQIASAFPHQLSGGQCQRVCIAMALALGPEILIADEPTTALDVTSQAQIVRLLRALCARRRLAVLFITHDLALVSELADRIAVMQAGRIVEAGPAAAVLANAAHPYARALIEASRRARPEIRRAVGETVTLSAENLSKRFASGRGVRNVDLRLRAGETLTIVGESGSGKSTLGRMLAGLVTPTSGDIRLDGADLTRLPRGERRRRRRRIQLIFQDPFAALNPRRSIGGALRRAAELGGTPPAEAKAQAMDLLRRVGLTPDAYERRPAAFSGGERQRICIARALALRPDVLIADECVSALDPPLQTQILALLERLRSDLAFSMIFITHDLGIAAEISDTILVMRDGRVVEGGEAQTVLRAPRAPYTRSLVDAVPGRPFAAPPPEDAASKTPPPR